MTLTPDDIKRPAVIRLNRVINTLTGIVWFPLMAVSRTVFLIALRFDEFADSFFDKSMDMRDYLLAAFVKRWPTPKAETSMIGMYHCREHGGYGFASDCVECNFANLDLTKREHPLRASIEGDILRDATQRKMTPEEAIAQRNSWGAGYSASVDKARAAGTYRDTVPLPDRVPPVDAPAGYDSRKSISGIATAR